MNKLTRVLLVNWHYIVCDVLEFERVTFLTGKTGAGKSTILDAMQVVILGDTTGHFFNKAANDDSRRTLRGYLRGEIAEEEEKGIVYLREGQFSSYIVLEFTDTQKRKHFCCGIVFDNFPDGKYEHRFFSLEGVLPDFCFIRDETPLDISGLRQWGQSQRDRLEMYESNKRYQEVFLGKMGRLNRKFYRLFRKAVPFSPIMNVAGFISEFVCDVQHELDIADMRENIRQYRRMEQELNRVRKRVDALERIDHKHQELEGVRERVRLYQYLLERAEIQTFEESAARISARIGECDMNMERLTEEGITLENSFQEGQQRREEWVIERTQSSDYVQLQKLQSEKRQLEIQFEKVQAGGERQDRIFSQHGNVWRAVQTELSKMTQWFTTAAEAVSSPAYLKSAVGESAEEFNEDFQLAALTTHLFAAIQPLLESAEHALRSALPTLPKPYDWRGRTLQNVNPDACWVDIEALQAAVVSFATVAEALRDGYRVIRDEVADWEVEKERLSRAVGELRRGVKQYDAKVVNLQRAIKEDLRHRAGEEVGVEIFADLLDVKNPDWQRALEGFLHTQRFYLIVPPDHFLRALQTYDRVKKELALFDVGLVDMGKVLEQSPERAPGSLAEEIETDHPYAQAYADLLLGRVMKCDRVEDLRQHRTAITKDGMLYQNFVARQLNPRRWETLYIGKRAIEQQLQKTLTQWKAVVKALQIWQSILISIGGWTKHPVLTDYELENVRETQHLLDDLPRLQEAYHTVIDQLGSLDLTRIQQLDGLIVDGDKNLERIRGSMRKVDKRQGEVSNERDELNRKLSSLQEKIRDGKQRLDAEHDTLFVTDEGEPKFVRELQRLGSVDALVADFGHLKGRDDERQVQIQRELVDLRVSYNKEFLTGFDIHKKDNDAFNHELQLLRNSQLTEYEEKIREAEVRAQVQFQEDFISKLRNNIETVEQQINKLNEAIRSVPFGRDRYRFQVKANQQYDRFYRMIMDDLLLEGYSLFSQPFLDRYKDTIEELFLNIVDTSEPSSMAQTELEKNLHKFTDYRTYLDFDLIVKDEEGHESRLSRVISKKSGGETQTPFYISVLASFSQIYRVRQTGFDNTLRLIVFDEAYSKMDHQRIKESIRLIRDLDLQVVLSAPTEKMADIVPQVDRTLVVTRIRNETRVSAFDPKKGEVDKR